MHRISDGEHSFPWRRREGDMHACTGRNRRIHRALSIAWMVSGNERNGIPGYNPERVKSTASLQEGLQGIRMHTWSEDDQIGIIVDQETLIGSVDTLTSGERNKDIEIAAK